MGGLTTSAFLWGDRHFPPALVAQQAEQLQASGVVDYMSHSTQLGSFIPRQLWTAENAPMAAVIDDPTHSRTRCRWPLTATTPPLASECHS
jgi:hypothetical protein